MAEPVKLDPSKVKRVTLDPNRVKPAFDIGQPESISEAPTWYEQAANTGKNLLLGAGKELASQGIQLGEAISPQSQAMKVFGIQNPSLEAQKQALEPVPGLQETGASIAKFAPYAAGIVPEMAATDILTGATKEMPSIVRWLLNTAGRAGIGAATNAGAAEVSGDNPAEAAKIGGAITGTMQGLSPLGKVTGEFMKDWARTSMLRALNPSTQSEKAAAVEVVDELLSKNWWWARPKGLVKQAQEMVDELLAKRGPVEEAARARFPENIPTVPSGEALNAFDEAARNEFLTGRTATGEAMGNEWGDEEAYTAFVDYVNKFILPKIKVGEQGGYLEVPEILKNKAATQKRVAEKGGFLGELMRDPLTSARDKAARVFAWADKKLTDAIMGDDWKQINEALHDYLTIRDLGKGLGLKSVGEVTPFAERLFTGFGMHFGPGLQYQVPGLMVRGARQATGAPWYNTTVANLKDAIANRLLGTSPQGGVVRNLATPTTERIAALAAFLGSEENKPEQGQTVSMGTGEVPQNSPLLMSEDELKKRLKIK